MLAVMGAGSVTLYRRVGREMVLWRVVEGTDDELHQAVASARMLDLMAARLGGWAHALVLGLDPAKPVHSTRISSSGVFLQDKLDGRLGKT